MQLDSQGLALLDYLNNRLTNVKPGSPETYVTYKTIHEDMGLSLIAGTYGLSLRRQGLDNIAMWAFENNLPGITGLVIEETTLQPSAGYYNFFGKKFNDFAWWKDQILQTKMHDWYQYLQLNTLPSVSGFEHWLIINNKSQKTAKNYTGAITGSLSKWALDANILEISLTDVLYAQDVLDVMDKLSSVDIYNERNSKGGSMYSCALKAYASYLREISSDYIEDDISDIQNNTKTGETEKSTLINARVGQGQYRKNLIKYWNGCALTGYGDTSLLIASHIKPWRESNNKERLDHFNGLMLMPNLDKIFDRGYISFKEQGDIIISPILKSPNIFGVDDNMKIVLSDEHNEYMSYHREYVFRT